MILTESANPSCRSFLTTAKGQDVVHCPGRPKGEDLLHVFYHSAYIWDMACCVCQGVVDLCLLMSILHKDDRQYSSPLGWIYETVVVGKGIGCDRYRIAFGNEEGRRDMRRGTYLPGHTPA